MKSQCCKREALFITAAMNDFAFESSKTRCLYPILSHTVKRVVVSSASRSADERHSRTST